MAVRLAHIPAALGAAEDRPAADKRGAARQPGRIGVRGSIGAGIERADREAVVGARDELFVERRSRQHLLKQFHPLIVARRGKVAGKLKGRVTRT